MTLPTAAALFVTLLLLSLAPGPTEVILVARSASRGHAAGAAMVVGILLADAVLVAVAFAGISVVATSSGELSSALSALAAAFLLYLGLGQLGRPPAALREGSARGQTANVSTGLALTLADPKALLGYAALLPAFVEVEGASILDAVAVLGVASVAICIAKGSYVAAAGRASARFLTLRVSSALNGLSGGALIAVALVLLTRAAMALGA